MIISEKFKYIFIGLPMTGSTAISRELIENYDGKSILYKHSNINNLKKQNITIEDYYIFTIYRDPIDMCFSQYNKIISNHKGSFDLELVKSKTPKNFKLIKSVKNKELSFLEYIKHKYRYHPYDNNFSLNKNHCSLVIPFNDLSNGFDKFLKACKILKKRNLPIYNKTIKSHSDDKNKVELNLNLVSKVFGPFLIENNNYNYKKRIIKFRLFPFLKYKFLKPIRFFYDKVIESKRTDKLDEFKKIN